MPFLVRSASAAVAAALAIGLAPAASASQPRDTLFPGQGNPGYQVRHYAVSLHYAPRTNHLRGVATIFAHAEALRDDFHLDLSGLHVRRVTVDGTTAQFSRHSHELVVRPRRPIAGNFTVVVRYDGTPRQHTDPDGSTEGWVRTADGATALGEPVGTMTWLPANNTPGDKATYTYRVDVPRTHRVAANGELVRRIRHGARTTWVWQAREPMSTYLATVSIGRFRVDRSTLRSITGRRIPVWSFADPALASDREARRLLPRVIRFEERRFGTYPFRSAGMIVDDAKVGYALETQSRPFYPSPPDTTTLVHETAHQWFGDSVTVRDWHDLWLAEGFATYAEWLWSARHGGPTTAARFDHLYATPRRDDLWHPAPTEFTDPADLFGTPTYERGAMTLQVLRQRVGTHDFFTILRRWARAHRHGNVTTAEFESLADRVSDRDLGPLFEDWLRTDGKPRGY